VLKERIQEILEFTKSESPYRKANKGWINQDIFLDLSPSPDQVKQKKEDAKVTLFWSPINRLLSNIFLIIIVCSILVFSSVSFAKGRFDFNLFNNYEIFINKDFLLFRLDFVKNYGAAFNIFSGSILFLSFISIIFSKLLIYLILRKNTLNSFDLYSYSFILGGTIGNGIDRIYRGFVVDFINLNI